ncbi:hypothetical protein [Thermococcus nautili]|uniref:Uncharacterized protein n=1 Tax=Thermococcus nautili TaxID=195522 RepID=W8NX84_9EURY|nr:hypothetical protein [Thermococcus nautili]AHL23797.1 hypothetical protein BD01_2207 [Thermococcus nautili]CAI1492126.1 conserved protein of unknown function [Thermococcus nautili]
MKGFIYNAEGLSLPIEFAPGVPFKFECGEEECGKRVVIEGVVVKVDSDEFTRVLERTVEDSPDFKKILEITARRYVFRGKVNGKEVELPVESFEDFAKRFLDEVLVLKG